MSTQYLIILFLGVALISCNTPKQNTVIETAKTPTSEEFYQLKVYTCKTSEQVETIDNYLASAYLPALKRLGIQNTGVFKPRINEIDTIKNIYVLVPFSSMDQFLELENNMANDSIYLIDGNEYISAYYDAPPYDKIESILLKAFEEMPTMKTPDFDSKRADHVYELRSYKSATEALYHTKVEMFNAGGEVALFDKLGFNAVFYGEVLSGSSMPNLMYMTTFPDQETRDSLWSVFRNSPEWTELKTMPKYQNTVSHIDILFLYPTEYSDY